jgi:hypothetical protein
MTQTTTELLARIRNNISMRYRSGAMIDARELDNMISEGEPLPDQWRGKSDRDVVEAWWMSDRSRRMKAFVEPITQRVTVKLYQHNAISAEPQYFGAPTPDEAYALAAKWCKENP